MPGAQYSPKPTAGTSQRGPPSRLSITRVRIGSSTLGAAPSRSLVAMSALGHLLHSRVTPGAEPTLSGVQSASLPQWRFTPMSGKFFTNGVSLERRGVPFLGGTTSPSLLVAGALGGGSGGLLIPTPTTGGGAPPAGGGGRGA